MKQHLVENKSKEQSNGKSELFSSTSQNFVITYTMHLNQLLRASTSIEKFESSSIFNSSESFCYC